MADPRFFPARGPFTLAQLAEYSGAEIARGAAEASFVDVAPLGDAAAEHVSFLDNKRYVSAFERSAAGACLVHPDFADRAPAEMALLTTPEPYRAYAKVAAAFHPMPPVEAAVSPHAVVDPAARVDASARIEPGAVIEAGSEVGAGSLIGPGAVLHAGVAVGPECRIGAGAVLQNCLVGARVIIHPGVRVGQDGFGFAPGPGGHLKVPQLGRVLIEDDVEIGANTTIDRGTGPDTVIGAGTKIDNLVQIAHNVRLGRGCIVVSQVGISGSTEIGDFVMIGGQAGLTGHLHVGAGARIAAQSGVMRDIEPGTEVGGSPAKPVKAWLKEVATLERLTKAGKSDKRNG